MQIPPDIILKDVAETPLIDQAITRGIAKLERVCDYIISVRIALEREQGRRQAGNPYRMRIDVRIPDRADIIVKRASKALKKAPASLENPTTRPAIQGELRPEGARPVGRGRSSRREIPEEPLPTLIRRTFDSARRELMKMMDKQHGNIKTPAQQETQAVVEKIFRDQEYGFLRTLDGQQVYFHRNSVLHRHWDRLTPGTIVRYTPEEGEKGLQASTVEPVDKPGAAEAHGQLHDLPAAPP
jgi:cold shock CspA family protein